MKNRKIAYVPVISLLMFFLVFCLSINVSAYDSITFTNENYLNWTFGDLVKNVPEIASCFVEGDWDPRDSQIEVDLERENNDAVPWGPNTSWILAKSGRNTIAIWGGLPNNEWPSELHNISNYISPEPSDMILLGLLLLSFVVMQRKKVFKK